MPTFGSIWRTHAPLQRPQRLCKLRGDPRTVQNGKFAACALPFSTNALNSVDCTREAVSAWRAPRCAVAMSVARAFPTLGKPTMPVFNDMLIVDVL
jgi:hypothetical protein